MAFSLIPHYAFRSVTDITAEFLRGLGIKFLMLDLDNTIAAYGERVPSYEALDWIESIKSAGVKLFIISNSRRKTRVDSFSEALGVAFVKNARKPSPTKLLQAMEAHGFGPDESALAGDQVFTDTLSANLADIVSIIVSPLIFNNPLLALRYAAETPFRAACKNKMCTKINE